MKFDRLELRNFKPYGDAAVELTDGVTVVHGVNGSGKSSLLDACFFALYGATATDGTLADVITNGRDETDVELWFTHDGESYHVTREVRTYGDRASTATCTLETTEGELLREGATDVGAFVTDLLRMDAAAFVNCAYVKQGEVNKLIDATPRERRDMIDDLLQLGRLEEYRERAGEARLGVADVLAERRGALESLDDRIERKEERDLHGRLDSLQSELSEVDDKIERFEGEREKAESTREEAQSLLDEYEQRRERLNELASEIDQLESEITETESERSEIAGRIADLRERRSSLQSDLQSALAETEIEDADPETVEQRRQTLQRRESEHREKLLEARDTVTDAKNRAKRHRETAADKRERAERKRSEADSLESELEAKRDDLADLRDRRSAAESEREQLRAEFADAPVDVGEAASFREEAQSDLSDVREALEDVRTDLKNVRSAVEQGEELLAAGNCPECGQPVEESPHVDSLDERRAEAERLESELDSLREDRRRHESRLERAEQLQTVERDLDGVTDTLELLDERITETETTIEETGDRIGRLREEAATLETEADSADAEANAAEQTAAEAREQVAAANAEIQSVQDAKERLDRVESVRTEIDEVETEIDQATQRRDSLKTVNDQRRETLADKRERRDDLAAEVDEEAVEQARQRLSNAEGYIERVTAKLESLRERRDELTNDIGAVQNELDELDTLREERETVATEVAALEQLRDETESLETAYGDLRAELRRQNVESLERRLNETFELVYGNDAYSHIELDDQYELTVYQKDGESLEPEQLSGGERALFNLSLRCGIYRLLAEGVEGTAPTPPLILDEPTVFLDDGHVSRLVDLVEEMRALGVNQIVIVSHDDELVGAADELVRVEKNPTTNRSSVERVEAASLADLRDPSLADD